MRTPSPNAARAAARTTLGDASAAATAPIEKEVLSDAAAAAEINALVALTEIPSRAERMEPEALTSIASSHKGQHVGRMVSVSDAFAMEFLAAVCMLHSNPADCGGTPKYAPTYAAEVRSAGLSTPDPDSAQSYAPKTRAETETALGGKLVSLSGGPRATNTLGGPAFQDSTAHVRDDADRVAASLADGQRLSHRRNSDSGSPSESDAKLRAAVTGSVCNEKTKEKGRSDADGVAVELGATVTLADCDCE